MDISSITTLEEALTMVEKLKQFITNESNNSQKLTKIVPFELYESKNGELRIITPSEDEDKFYLGGLNGSITLNFSDYARTLDDWLEYAMRYEFRKSNKQLGRIASTSTACNLPEFHINGAVIKSIECADILISKLNEYIKTFNRIANVITIEDIKPYEIFAYGIAVPKLRMLVPVYSGEIKQFILTGMNSDITLSFDMDRKSLAEWHQFAILHEWKKTNTKLGIVDKINT